MFNRVIHPEEQTLKNYLNPSFWFEKQQEYREMREKEKQDLDVYAVLSEGARPTIDYYILTVLSCIIATVGLIQGSTAVIIGAMIIAPLMTPILAFSLGVIWGDLFLFRVSLSSIFKGTFWAVAISSAIAFIIPLSDYLSEILSRTHPSVFDVTVALASGIVGAYGYANKRISNSLTGIAIAVALMPPLCTIGIGLGNRDLQVAGGAALLFAINLVSIGLAGAVVFWLMKIHPITEEDTAVRRRALSQILISLLDLVIITVPVGFYMYEGYMLEQAETRTGEAFRDRMPGYRVHEINRELIQGRYVLHITLTGTRPPDPDAVTWIRGDMKKNHEILEEIHVHFLRSIEPTGNQ
jgi:uncharacterized hydrophobic protein (TIGR00271 family)